MAIIHLYCLFGNEEKLMPYFMRHYAPEVDQLFMLDGKTTEATKNIINQYDKATIIETPFTEGEWDERKVAAYKSGIYQQSRGKADWVIMVDADEFLFFNDGIRRTLEKYQDENMRVIKMQGYQMVADKFPESDKQLTDLVRHGVRDQIYDKVSALDPRFEIHWKPGGHDCFTNGTIYSPGMKLLHYRYFGEAYLKQRNARQYARLKRQDIAQGLGVHVVPEYQYKYGLKWWQDALKEAGEVI